MSRPPYKQMEVCDKFTPERIMTFTRPHENDDTIVISTRGNPPYCEPKPDFHLDAGTLGVIATILQSSPSTKEIK